MTKIFLLINLFVKSLSVTIYLAPLFKASKIYSLPCVFFPARAIKISPGKIF